MIKAFTVSICIKKGTVPGNTGRMGTLLNCIYWREKESLTCNNVNKGKHLLEIS
jgi:hypothetical protein